MTTNIPVPYQPTPGNPVITGNLQPPAIFTGLANDTDYTVTIIAHLADGTTIEESKIVHTQSSPPPVSPVPGTINQYGMSGTGVPGSKIRLYDANGNLIAEVEVDASGHWNIPASMFPGGTSNGFTGSVSVVDPNGNVSQTSSVGPIDGVAPNIPVITSQNATGITGTAEPGSTITLRNSSGSSVAVTTVDALGNWTIPASSFTGGTTSGFVGTVTATDAAGNESVPLAVGPIDATPPTRPFPTAISASGISGVAEPGSTINLYDASGNLLATVIADGSGNWSIPASSFPGGTTNGFTGYITATDPNGNTSAKTTLTNLNTQAPLPPVITTSNSIQLAGTAEAGSTIKLMDGTGTVVATTVTDSNGNWSIPAADFPGGITNGFSGTLAATNTIGTSTPTAVLPIIGTAPAAPVIVTANKLGLTGTSVAGYTIKMLNSSLVEVASAIVLNDGTWSILAANFPGGIADGFIGSCYAVDTFGNISTSVTISSIDGTPPVAPIIASANSYGLAGTADAGSRISLRDSTGAEVAFTFADMNGNWTIPASSFPGGVTEGFKGSIVTTDAAGNESPAVVVNTIDGTPPATPSLTSYLDNVGSIASATSIATTTDDTTPGLNVGIKLADTPKMYIDNILVDSIYAAATGVLTPKVQLADGSYNFTYTLTDSVGNESIPSPALAITIDTTAPTVALTSYTDDIGSITSTSSTAATTDDTRPGMNVGIGSTDTFKLYINGSRVLATYNSAAGTLTPDNALTDGSYIFSYKATDAAGNESLMSPSITIIIDTVSPTTPSSAPLSYVDNVGSITSNTSVAVLTDDSTPGINVGTGITSTVKLYVNNILTAATYNSVDGTLTPNSPLSDGLKNITYTLSDDAGNESGKSPIISMTIDTSVPTGLSLTSYTDNVGTIQSTTSTAAVTDDTRPGMNIGTGIIDTPKLYVGGILTAATYDSNAGTLTPNVALIDGTYSFTYTLTDASGNTSLPSAALSITIDTVAPSNPLAAPASYIDDVGSITSNTSVAVTTDDTRPGIKIGTGITSIPKLYANHLLIPATYNSGTGAITPNVALADGTYDFTYTLSDAAGNESAHSPAITIVIDTQAPLAPANAPASYSDDIVAFTNATSVAPLTNDNKPGINIGYGLTNTPKLYVNGTLTAATYDAVTGTLTPNSAVSDGLKSFTYTLTDAAGNESGQSPAISFTIDATPPVTPAPTTYKDIVGSIQSDTNSSTKTDDTTPGMNIGTNIADIIKFYVNGTLTAATYDSVAGTLTPDTGLTDGTYDFTYTLTDAAGNESSLSPALRLIIDTIAPTISTVTLSWGATLDYGESFRSATVTVDTSGMEDGQIISVVMNGTTYTGTVTSNSGTVTIPAAALTGLTNKANASLTTSATDLAGNTSSSITSTFYVDYTPGGWVSIINNQGTVWTDWHGSAVNSNGDVFVVGYGFVYYAPYNNGSYDIHIAKFNKHGILQWQNQLTNTAIGDGGGNYPNRPLDDVSFAMCIDSSDNIFFTGYTQEQYDGAYNTFYKNTLVGKANSSGDFQWAKMLGNKTTRPANTGDDIGQSIATDSAGNVYMVGTCSDNFNTSSRDVIIAKYSSSGSQLWKHTLNSGLWDEGEGLSITVNSANVYVAAYSYYPSFTGFLIKYNTSGVFQWQKSMVGLHTSVTTDGDGNVYVTGYIASAVYILKYNPAGQLLWKRTTRSNVGYTLAGNYTSPKLACYGDNLYLLCGIGYSGYSAISHWTTDGRLHWINGLSSGASTVGNSIFADEKFIYLTVTTDSNGTITGSPIIKLRVDGSQNGGYVAGYVGLLYTDYSDYYTDTTSTLMESTGELTPLTYTVPELSMTMTTDSMTTVTDPLIETCYLIGDERPPVILSYIDDVLAVTNTYSTEDVSNDPTPTLHVTTGLSNPKLYINGSFASSTYNSVAGTLSLDNPLVYDGIYTFRYTIDDINGNTSPMSAGLTITLDTVTPNTPDSAPTGYYDDVGYLQSFNGTGTATDDAIPSLSIPAGITDTPILYVDTVLVASVYDSINGILTPITPLSDGTHTLTYSIIDEAGNESGQSPAFTITIDTTPPTTPLVAPYSYVDQTGVFGTSAVVNYITGLKVNNYSGITWYRVYATATGQPETVFTTTHTVDPNDSSKVILTFATPASTYGTLVDTTWTFKYALLDDVGNESGKSPGISVSLDSYAAVNTVTKSWGSSLDAVGASAGGTVTATTAGVDNGGSVTFSIRSHYDMSTTYVFPDDWPVVLPEYTATVSNNFASAAIPAAHFYGMAPAGYTYSVFAKATDSFGNESSGADFTVGFTLDYMPSVTAIPNISWGSLLTAAERAAGGTISVTTSNAIPGSIVRVYLSLGPGIPADVSRWNTQTVSGAATTIVSFSPSDLSTLAVNASYDVKATVETSAGTRQLIITNAFDNQP